MVVSISLLLCSYSLIYTPEETWEGAKTTPKVSKTFQFFFVAFGGPKIVSGFVWALRTTDSNKKLLGKMK